MKVPTLSCQLLVTRGMTSCCSCQPMLTKHSPMMTRVCQAVMLLALCMRCKREAGSGLQRSGVEVRTARMENHSSRPNPLVSGSQSQRQFCPSRYQLCHVQISHHGHHIWPWCGRLCTMAPTRFLCGFGNFSRCQWCFWPTAGGGSGGRARSNMQAPRFCWLSSWCCC